MTKEGEGKKGRDVGLRAKESRRLRKLDRARKQIPQPHPTRSLQKEPALQTPCF